MRQRKTGRLTRFELTDQTRMAIDEYLRLTDRKQVRFCSPDVGTGHVGDHPTICPSRAGMGGKHRSRSRKVRHALPAHESSADLPADWEPQGGATFAWPFEDRSTVRYLGIEVDDAIEIAEKIDIWRIDAIRQSADVVGDGQIVADLSYIEVRYCIAE